MSLVEVKTAELIGPALDWAVAEAIGWKEPIFGVGLIRYFEEDRYLMMETPDPNEPDDVTKPHHFNHYEQWSPSRIWSQGGPLIERERIGLWPSSTGYFAEKKHFGRHHKAGRNYGEGPAHLIAAMRCLCCAKLGDTVHIPEALCLEPSS